MVWEKCKFGNIKQKPFKEILQKRICLAILDQHPIIIRISSPSIIYFGAIL